MCSAQFIINALLCLLCTSALQEAGQIGMSELAIQYALHTELLASMLQSRIGTIIKVRAGELAHFE